LFTGILQTKKKTIYFFIIIFSLSRFFYLNYINWTSGALCTGEGGIQYGYDAWRYLDGADRVINHQAFIIGEEKYIGYSLLIAFVKILGLDLSFVLIMQLIFALLASLALYDIGDQSHKVNIWIAGGRILPYKSIYHSMAFIYSHRVLLFINAGNINLGNLQCYQKK